MASVMEFYRIHARLDIETTSTSNVLKFRCILLTRSADAAAKGATPRNSNSTQLVSLYVAFWIVPVFWGIGGGYGELFAHL